MYAIRSYYVFAEQRLMLVLTVYIHKAVAEFFEDSQRNQRPIHTAHIFACGAEFPAEKMAQTVQSIYLDCLKRKT